MSTSKNSAVALNDIFVDGGPINHAIGTKQADHIHGYASWNAPVIGNVLIGLGGDDYILSEVWTDWTSDGISVSRGGAGNDHIETYVETYGSASASGSGGTGADRVELWGWSLGGETADIRGFGDDGADTIRLFAFGEDALAIAHGGAGRDVLRAEIASSVETDYGVITVTNLGHSELNGGGGRDTLVTVGGEWNEVTGGGGNDRSILGTGHDTFFFTQVTNQGADTIVNWDRAEDDLVLYGWDGKATVVDDGVDVRITFTNGSSIKFVGVGDGTTDSIYDLMDDPGQIDWLG